MTKFFITSAVICFTFLLSSCASDSGTKQNQEVVQQQENFSSESDSARSIIQSAIKSSGMHLLDDARVNFDFRDKHYIYHRDKGIFHYERQFTDKDGNKIKDVLSNEGFTRWTNNDSTVIDEKKANAFSNSINSVMYFAFLPLRLEDPAVEAQYLSKVNIKEKSYHKIQVTFSQEGGGDDFEDVFIYWFDTDNYRMDFLAYEYHTDGGGMRFREAYNSRILNGVLIQDYKNYKPREKGSIPIKKTDEAFQNDELELLSEINLENAEIVLD